MKNDDRYIRQKALPQVGDAGQVKIQNTRVLIVGCGGLGSALLPYLASAGIRTIGIMDGDTVSLSNLHRQVLYCQEDIGMLKVDCASQKIKKLNPTLTVDTFPAYLSVENAIQIIANYDIVVDATDRIPARYLINDACVLSGKPFVHAALYRFQSQVSVFNYKNGPTYRCLYPEAPITTQSCDTAGILGSSVAIVGGLQANEVMKIILDAGEILSGQLLINDFLQNKQSVFKFGKNEKIQISNEFFENEHRVNVKNYAFAKAEKSLLLDVRSASETPQITTENYLQIPLQALAETIETLPKEQSICIFCKSGTRSREAYGLLKRAGITNAYCLTESAQELYEHLKNE